MEHYMVPVCIATTLYNTLNHGSNFLMYNIVHLVVYLSRVAPSIVYNQTFQLQAENNSCSSCTMCQKWNLIVGLLHRHDRELDWLLPLFFSFDLTGIVGQATLYDAEWD